MSQQTVRHVSAETKNREGNNNNHEGISKNREGISKNPFGIFCSYREKMYFCNANWLNSLVA